MTATCACGGISITLSSGPRFQAVCHCTDCKRRTGSAFGISLYFARDAVTEVAGETAVYAFRHRTQDQEQERHFCKRCGTTLYWFISTMPDKIGVAGGCFGEQALPEPGMSVSDGKRKPWVTLPPAWKVHEG
jgi:hypothetical protein